MDKTRLSVVHQAASRGSLFVRKGLLTVEQLTEALGAVAEGSNFDVVLLAKRWVTEEEIECVDRCLTDPDKHPNGNARQIAHVAVNRVSAQQKETRSVFNEITRIATVIQTKASAMPVPARERRDSGEFCCEP